MSWLPFTVLCHFFLLMHGVCADFGLPEGVPDAWLVEFNANQLRDALRDVVGPLQRIPVVIHLDSADASAKILEELVKNVSELGRNVSENFGKASREKTASVEEVFTGLKESSDTFKTFLERNASVYVAELGLKAGNTSAEEFRRVLTNVNSATGKVEDAAIRLEDVIRNSSRSGSIPVEMTRGLAISLSDLRDQVKILRGTVDAIVNSIQTANSHLENVGNLHVTTGIRLNLSFEDLFKVINSESSSAINKFQNGIKNIDSELAGAVRRLTMFTSASSLLKLQDSISESFTRTYYNLFNREEPNVSTIKQEYQTLRSNMSDLLESSSQNLLSDIQATASSLASMILARSASSERCNSMLAPRITGAFGLMQNEIVSCINRERGRLSRIADSVDKVMQLLQITAADFASDLASCSRFGSFANDRAEFAKAKGCLETNLREFDRYDQLIDSVLPLLQPSIQREAEASRFRMHMCVTQSTDELRSLMDDTRQAVDTCVGSVA